MNKIRTRWRPKFCPFDILMHSFEIAFLRLDCFQSCVTHASHANLDAHVTSFNSYLPFKYGFVNVKHQCTLL